jgi:hypothetical protein
MWFYELRKNRIMKKETVGMEEPFRKTVKNQTGLAPSNERRDLPLQNRGRSLFKPGSNRLIVTRRLGNRSDKNGFCVFISTSKYSWFNSDRAKVKEVSSSNGKNIFYKVFLKTCSYEESLRFAKDEGVIAFKWTALTVSRHKYASIGRNLSPRSAGTPVDCDNKKCVVRCAGIGCLCVAGECV